MTVTRPASAQSHLALVRDTQARPRLLLLAQTLPFPPDGGVHIRIFNVLKLLALEYDVTLLCFTRRAEREAEESVAAGIAGLRQYAKVQAFPIPQEYSRIRLLWDHFRSLITGKAYVWYAYQSAPFARAVDEALNAESYDLVQLDSLDLASYLPAFTTYPVVCVHHNVESALLVQRARKEPNRLKRWYIARQARQMAELERVWCARVALNVAVSDDDRDALQRRIPAARFATVPNGVDIETFRPAPGTDEGIVSTGGLNWFPNADALEHFCADILPRIRAEMPFASVRWVGRSNDDIAAKLWTESRVELTGHVADIRPYVHEAGCFVVPLRIGGGTRLKILDAWAMGKAIVSTTVGCSGLDAIDGHNILIRDDPAEFASAVTTILRDRELRHRIGAAGRRTVEERYSWTVIGTGMRATLDTLQQDAERRPGFLR